MVYASHLFRFISTIALFIGTAHQASIPSVSDDGLTNSTSLGSSQADQRVLGARPFYVIAHRVLTSKGIDDALRNGANAFEIDMSAFNEGWWADHDHTAGSWRDSAKDIFNHIANQRQSGKSVALVWLDIKTPDYCDPDDSKWFHCSVGGLRDLARQILQPAGVRVLFGNILPANTKAYPYLRDSLNNNEAINLDGDPKEALRLFESGGPRDISRRVPSYGSADITNGFGNCYEDSWYTCTELRQAVESGKFGKVFGWTSSAGQGQYVVKEMEIAGVDGIIYGYENSDYNDSKDTRSAANDIIRWANDHPDRRFVATNNYPPW
ncbi:MAG: hypothetical protein Q9225_001386 [Loekoesia sp. 1 TL-2023]